jgi:hypothetical protein
MWVYLYIVFYKYTNKTEVIGLHGSLRRRRSFKGALWNINCEIGGKRVLLSQKANIIKIIAVLFHIATFDNNNTPLTPISQLIFQSYLYIFCDSALVSHISETLRGRAKPRVAWDKMSRN